MLPPPSRSAQVRIPRECTYPPRTQHEGKRPDESGNPKGGHAKSAGPPPSADRRRDACRRRDSRSPESPLRHPRVVHAAIIAHSFVAESMPPCAAPCFLWMFPVEFVTHFRGSPNPAKPAARRASARLRWPVRPVRARAVRAVRTTALCVGAAHDCVPVLCARCARAVCRRHVRARAHACCACPCCACSSCAPSCWACGALVQRSSRSCFARQCRRPRGCAGPCFVLVLCMLALCCPWGSS